MLGRGGVDIETFDDVTFRTIPTVRPQAESMFDELRSVGSGAFDPGEQAALADAVVALSDLYFDNSWIREADVNPVVVSSDGVTAVDSLFVRPE